MSEFEVEQVTWLDKEPQLRAIRTQVFIEEQHVPVELEWDGKDLECIHLLVKRDDATIATARLLNTGQIGRMAVLKPYRDTGIGTAMLKKILSIAHSINLDSVFLNAQLDAVSFYEKFKFIKQGAPFDDAGISHIRMVRTL